MEAKGVTEYMWDIVYVTWGVLGLVGAAGDWGWWIWVCFPPLQKKHAMAEWWGFVGNRPHVRGLPGRRNVSWYGRDDTRHVAARCRHARGTAEQSAEEGGEEGGAEGSL